MINQTKKGQVDRTTVIVILMIILAIIVFFVAKRIFGVLS